MKKVLFVSNTAFSLYFFRRALMLAMKEKGWRVIALGHEDSYVQRLESSGVVFHHIPIERGGKNPFRDLWYLFQLFLYYRREQPELVHHFTIKPIIYGSVAARLARIPSIVNTITGLGSAFTRETWITWLVRSMYRFSLRFSEQTIFQNPDDRQQFLQWGLVDERKTSLVRGSGVDTTLFSMEDEATDEIVPRKKSITFLMASRMLWDKGVREYVEACQMAKATLTSAQFLLVGGVDADNPSSLPKEWLESVHTSGVVQWRGEVMHDEMRHVLRKADIVVLPSYREGVPRILLEAASMGKPLITTDTPGCREVVVNGENGYLVPPRDSQALALAMLRLASDADAKERMGSASRRRAIELFDDQRIVASTMQVYEEAGILLHSDVERQGERRVIFVSHSIMTLYMLRRSLMTSMKAKGWQVIAAGAPDHRYVQKMEALGIQFYPLQVDRQGANPFKDMRLVFQLLRLYRRLAPALVHHFTIKPVIYGSIAARLLRVPSIVNTITGLGHVLAREGRLATLLRALYRFSMKNGTHTLFVNARDHHYFIERGIVLQQHSRLISGEGVDTDLFSPQFDSTESSFSRTLVSRKEADVVFLMAARMLWDKGIREYVEACKIVRKFSATSRFLLVGGIDKGSPSSVPETWLRDVHHRGWVEWIGEVMHDEMRDILRSADIVVLPTYYREGVPRILLEAASVGKPLITTDTPGCRDVVVQGENGYLIQIRDSDALAQAMLLLARDPLLRTRMGLAGRKRVTEFFDDQRIVSQTMQAYEQASVPLGGL